MERNKILADEGCGMLRSTFVLFLFLAVANPGQSQILVPESNTRLIVRYGVAIPMGSEEATKGSFVSAALLKNFKSGTNATIQFTQRVYKTFHAGLSLSYSEFYTWSYPGSIDFDRSRVSINSIQFDLMYRSRFAEQGLMNKLSWSLGFSPGLYQTTLRSPNGLYGYIPGAINNGLSDYSLSTTAMGFSGHAGIEYVVHNYVALQLDCAYHSVPNRSVAYDDSRLTWMQITAGLVLRLGKKHNYLFRHD